MFATICVLCLIVLAAGKDIKAASHNLRPKIIGGFSVDIRNRPFMLSLHNTGGFLCGANILSRTWGLTALHCLVSATSTHYYVRAGSNQWGRGGSIHNVTKIHIYDNATYPYWFLRMLQHDIALFEVSPPFRYSKKIRAVRLPKRNSKPPHKLSVCGWGYTSIGHDEQVSDNLMGVYVQYVPFESCVKATTEYAMLVKKDHHLCYGTHGKDSCYGDSGGPLANRNTIYGIVSFGHSCGHVSGVYVKISYYRQWIREVTNL
ncbi:hypothetical protein KM043_006887 [Ampulex compressa]|nr:hypothetical protein KM043_006887 [Ampulex compressa]